MELLVLSREHLVVQGVSRTDVEVMSMFVEQCTRLLIVVVAD